MKKFPLMILSSLMLSACMLQTTQTGLSGCSLLGLQALDFYSGLPAKGKKIQPVLKNGVRTWTFNLALGKVYAVCGYADDEETVQLLPSQIVSCRASFKGENKTISDLSCDARM